MATMRITWVCSDHREFETEEAAQAYERSLERMKEVETFLTEVLKCTDRKRAEYSSVFNQFFLWSTEGWETLQPKLEVPKPNNHQPEIIRPAAGA